MQGWEVLRIDKEGLRLIEKFINDYNSSNSVEFLNFIREIIKEIGRAKNILKSGEYLIKFPRKLVHI